MNVVIFKPAKNYVSNRKYFKVCVCWEGVVIAYI